MSDVKSNRYRVEVTTLVRRVYEFDVPVLASTDNERYIARQTASRLAEVHATPNEIAIVPFNVKILEGLKVH